MMLTFAAQRSLHRQLAPVAQQVRLFAVAETDGPKKSQKKLKKTKKMSSAMVAAKESRGRELDEVIKALDGVGEKKEPVPPSAEEMERRKQVVRNYTIGRFKEHNSVNHDVACKIHLKKHAMNLLPRDTKLKEAAKEINRLHLIPYWKHIPMWTPPIKDFDPDSIAGNDDD
jgi:hypothetical protein